MFRDIKKLVISLSYVKYLNIHFYYFNNIFYILQIIRRAGPTEKVLVIAKNRKYHTCETSWIVVAMVAWEGIPQVVADDLYSMLVYKLNRYGQPTERR